MDAMDARWSLQFAWQFPGLLILAVATMPVVVMAAAAGGRRCLVDHLPATPPPSASTQASGGISSSSDDATSDVWLFALSFILTLYLSCFILHKFRRSEEVQQAWTGRDNDGRGGRSNTRQGQAPPPLRRQQPQRAMVAAVAPAAIPPPAVDVDMAPAQAPVLDCRFRVAEGWAEMTCSVCLSEMADGEKVRVLTQCMHCFHTKCVKKWLRDHATCPLCRAPTAASATPAEDDRRHPPTTTTTT